MPSSLVWRDLLPGAWRRPARGRRAAVLCLCAGLLLVGAASAATPELENIARGKPYTMAPAPGYADTIDPGDQTQLTDGEYTAGHFWMQKTTIGWVQDPEVCLTIDLGADLPISGVTFNMAAGIAEVHWPTSILVYVSLDGRAYYRLGDLVALDRHRPLPPEGTYSLHKYVADDLQTHGRYVRLVVDPDRAYVFVDEVEVRRGDDAWLQRPLSGEVARFPFEYHDDDPLTQRVKRRVATDLEAARGLILGAGLDEALRTRLLREVDAVEAGIGALPKVDPTGFRAVIPLNPLHGQVYALCGAVRAAQGRPRLAVWSATPWDFLAPLDLPESPPAATVAVAAMRGETRAAAVNLTNATAESITVTAAFAELAGSPLPDYIKVHDVAWTDTRQGVLVAAALPELTPGPDGYRVVVPAGMTRQLWLSITPRGLPAGTHRGALILAGGDPTPARVPIALRVFDLDFPARPTLHLGGWDETDADASYGVTPANREALIRHLRERGVDSPWSTPQVMPYGSYDAGGRLTQPPETARFQTWLQRWPDARRYCVFNAVTEEMAGTRVDSPLFPLQVGDWIRFWISFLRERGVEPERLVLLLLDEPRSSAQDRTIAAWAQAIKAVEPRIVLWEDPIYPDPTQALPEMLEAVDVLCPNRLQLLEFGEPFARFYREQQAKGRRLDLYSCSGPARLLDPYTYHRLQAWMCFDLGAESTFFWAFGDTGGGDSWNEYVGKGQSYSPLFLGADSVTPGRHMEAIRESLEDYEYLTLLRRRVAELEQAQPVPPQLPRAKELLATAPGRVLRAEGATEMEWQKPKDRSLADRVRTEIGELLEQLR